MKKAIRLIGVLSTAVVLGGCQSFPLTSWISKERPAAAAKRSALAENKSGALEEGKANLRSGNISAAVASFRIALLDPAARGEANNGLAVAYAKLGRADIAERYFRAAIEQDPNNPKFAANLLRLQQQVMLLRLQQQVMLARAHATPASGAQALAARANETRVASREALTGQATRISRAEVLIRSQPSTAAAPSMAVVYRDPEASAPIANQEANEEQLAMAPAAKALPITVTFRK